LEKCDTHVRSNIGDIQGSTDGTVKGISKIAEVINSVNQIVSTIAAAVEEQSASTREIATNIAQASKGIQEVNDCWQFQSLRPARSGNS